ncbi:MAG: hypothetical protein EOS56_28240 [Mesorhizobium sp.]|nr:MAG: hypothetical protein EOS55_05270 [Mesorhizobium sp.]RWC54578.1 MAG: hypothetical protein EOS56_28240 [Mesorhizobium sp.]RWC60384.1 MAG: hypothetical protein EOS29_20195 [Mesorhizobium sp.]
MQNLSITHGAVAPASHEAHPADVAGPLPSRSSSSPAGAKSEAPCLTAPAPGPVRPSPATGTAGAAAPSGSGPQLDRCGAGLPARSCIRTQDGTVILFEPATGRAVSAPDRKTAEARLSHSVEADQGSGQPSKKQP